MSNTTAMSLEDLKAAGIKGLAKRAGKSVTKGDRSTVALRKAALAENLEAFNIDALLELQSELASFVDLITLSLGDDIVLSSSSQFTLIKQKLGQRSIKEFAEVVDAKIKAIAFAHMDAVLEAEGVEDPEAHNAEITVAAAGFSYKREGAGYTDPSINEGLLAQLLGDELVEQVFVTEKVTTVQRTLSLDKLFAAVEADPKLMLKVEQALEPGKLKNAKAVLRPIT